MEEVEFEKTSNKHDGKAVYMSADGRYRVRWMKRETTGFKRSPGERWSGRRAPSGGWCVVDLHEKESTGILLSAGQYLYSPRQVAEGATLESVLRAFARTTGRPARLAVQRRRR